MQTKTIVIVVAFLGVFVSCKSSKAIIASGKASSKLSTKQVVKQHNNTFAQFNTLQTKVKIELKEGEDTQGHTFNFRMERNKAIWLNAFFGAARMLITPEKVQFYNKLDRTFFDGDFKLLSNFVGIDLDFNKVQAILLGQTMTRLSPSDFKVQVNDNSYWLKPKDKNLLYELFYLLNPLHFKIDSIQLQQQQKQRFLQIDYKAYQKVEQETLPKTITIISVEGTKEIKISMDFKAIKLNDPLRFPFKIPEGYKEIEI